MHLVDFARSFAARGTCDERLDGLVLRGNFADADEQSLWLQITTNPPAPFTYVQVYDVAVSGDVVKTEGFQADRHITINIQKNVVPEIAYFIFAEAAAAFLANRENHFRGLYCAEKDAFVPFSARGMQVGYWNANEPIKVPEGAAVISPRIFVRDLVPQREIVADISPWLLDVAPKQGSQLFEQWRLQSARSLLGAIVNTASIQEAEVVFETKGPPSWKVKADGQSLAAFYQISEAATWTYCSGEDRDVRHMILTGEIGRAARADITLSEIISFALENAKTAYEAHVQSASRETLKALTDLRKTVIEDTQKVTERARGLTGDLWRDVAVTAAPFIVKELQDTAMSRFHSTQALFYFGAAAFVCVSFGLQTQLNSAFFLDQERARDRWLEALFKYISQTERERIVATPIRDAMHTYRTTRNIVGCLYLFLVAVLMIAGLRTLE